MEGVGARFGRSSTRYGPATVFSGPVRKWKKRWIHVSPSNNSSNNNHHHSHQNQHHHRVTNVNGSNGNGSNGSHLLLYKWTPLSERDNNGNGNENSNNANVEKSSVKDDTTPEEPPRRKIKYIPHPFTEVYKKKAEDESRRAWPVDEVANIQKKGTWVMIRKVDEKDSSGIKERRKRECRGENIFLEKLGAALAEFGRVPSLSEVGIVGRD